MTPETPSSTRLAGRSVLVTGASSGIGEAVARAIVAAGGAVALLARRADRLADLATELGGVAVPADVTDLGAVTDAVAAAAAALGGLDGVVNAAGLMRPGTVTDGDAADFRVMLEVNVLGLLHVTQVALPHLRAAGRAGGSADVVNLSSMSGRRVPSATGGVYAGTKFAVHAITQGLRLELEGEPVRVTTMSPGFVATPLFDRLDGDLAAQYRDSARTSGMRPEIVADLVVTALGLPPEAELTEVAVMPTAQAAG